MRRIIILIILINLVLSANSQEIDREKKLDIIYQFVTDWEYFRMKRNPLLLYEETHDGANWRTPFLIPKIFFTGNYEPELIISEWGKPKAYSPDKFGQNEYIDLRSCGFYLVEKKDGLLGIKKEFMTDSIIDTMQLNIYDSIFPYDNRFLVKNIYIDGKGYSEDFSFHSGNVEWGEWKDVSYIKRVDYCGYICGVQFGIENVYKFRQDFSDKIKQFRPEFPDYVYTDNRSISLLTNGFVIIGAPEGKEDQLVEYIYYSNLPEKTGDSDITHYYEMRYILPTQIKSIKERRLEKRRLSDEEQKYILEGNNGMLLYLDGEESINLRAYKNSLKEKELNEVIN